MNWYIAIAWLVVVEFFIKQNKYFGWNLEPQSDAELMADGITLVLISLAALITFVTGEKS